MSWYTPVSEEQAMQDKGAEFELIEPGTYENCRVTAAKEDFSKNGNAMMRLTLEIKSKNNDSNKKMSVYLIDHPKMRFLIRHLAVCMGLEKEFNEGNFNASRILEASNIYGDVIIDIEKGKEKYPGAGEFWPDRNKVVDFVLGDRKIPEKSEKTKSGEFDDDIPF